MARDLTVTYGALVIGGGSDRQPTSVYRSNIDFETGQCTVDFVVANRNGGIDLEAEAATIEAEVRRLNQPFAITHANGQSWVSWSPADGYTTRASLDKPGDQVDTHQSRYYRLTVTVDVPATSADDGGDPRQGRRPPVVSVAFDDDRRRSVTISGEYTATGGSARVAATTNYETYIDALVASLLPGDADRWLCTQESYEADELDGVCRYLLTFREVTTDATITYGDLTVGDSSYPLADGVQVLRGYDLLSVSFDVEVPVTDARETGSTSWYQAAETLEAAFRRPRQNLRIAVGGVVIFEGEQAAGTIIDADPTIQRVGDPAIGGPLSRTFRVSIDAGLPADNLDLIEGRREADLSVQYDGARRRTMTITGTYTSTATNARAEDAYIAAIATYTTAVQTQTGGTWELIEESRDQFETGLQLQFSRTFRELLATQASPNLVEQQVSIVITTPGARDSAEPGATSGQSIVPGSGVLDKLRLARATIRGKVDHDEVGTEAEYDALIQSLVTWLYQRVFEIAQAQSIAVTSYDVDYQRDGWDVMVSVDCEYSSSGGWIEFRRSIARQIVTGRRIVPAWGGNRYSAYRYDGVGEVICTITDTGRHLQTLPSYDAPEPPVFAGAADFALVGIPQDSYEREVVGQSGASYVVYVVNRAWQYQQYAAISTQAQPGAVTT